MTLALLLDRLFPREVLPWGYRWRIFGRREPRADYSRCVFKWPEFFGRALYLHAMERGDQHRDHHDHRYNWFSIVLKGGYVESLLDPSGLVTVKHRRWLSCAWRPAMQPHTVEKLLAPVTWTLFATGRHQREWGFWCKTAGTRVAATDRPIRQGFYWMHADEYRQRLEKEQQNGIG